MSKTPKRHRHRWHVSSWSGIKKVTYRCQGADCDAEFTRPMDKEEQAYFQQHHGFNPPPEKNVHRVWHGMPLPEEYHNERGQDKKIEMAGTISNYAEKHPEEVICLGCDDTAHASSDLILVTHEADEKFMGTTVLMFPQCDGRPPAEFFLYPGHLDALLEALQAIKKRTKEKKKLEYKASREETRWWAKRARPDLAEE